MICHTRRLPERPSPRYCERIKRHRTRLRPRAYVWPVQPLPMTMAIGTPYELFGVSRGAGGATTVTLLTTHAVAAGDHILIVAANMTDNSAISSVSDPINGTYTAGTSITNGVGGPTIRPFYKENSAVVPIGTTITITYASSTPTKYIVGVGCSGLATSSSLGTQAAGATGSGTSLTIATGTLPQANCIVYGFCGVFQGSTTTVASGFTKVEDNTGGNTQQLEYKIVAATTTVSYHPTWVSSVGFAGNVISFKAPVAATTAPPFPALNSAFMHMMIR